MKDKKQQLSKIDLYFITDSKLTRKSVVDDVSSAIKAGVRIIQYREKEKTTRDMLGEAVRVKKLCKQNDVLFIVNDRIDIVLAANADGVHLGNEDMPYEIARKILGREKIIGLTVHNIEEAIEAEKMGADYIGISPIFETKTKPDAGEPKGIKLIEEIKEKIKIPFVAIGGINESNIESVLKAGAKSVAIISAIVGKPDVGEECRKFRSIILEHIGY